jgi:hypothetical protein
MKVGDMVKSTNAVSSIAHWYGIVVGQDPNYDTLPECWLVRWFDNGVAMETREWENELIIISKGAK